MPSSCAIYGCQNHRKKTFGSGVKYFRFPRDQHLRQRWIDACKRNNLNVENAIICSVHFEPHHYLDDIKSRLLGIKSPRKRRLLIPDAVPTLFLPKELEKGKESTGNSEKTELPEKKDEVQAKVCSKAKRKKTEPCPQVITISTQTVAKKSFKSPSQHQSLEITSNSMSVQPEVSTDRKSEQLVQEAAHGRENACLIKVEEWREILERGLLDKRSPISLQYLVWLHLAMHCGASNLEKWRNLERSALVKMEDKRGRKYIQIHLCEMQPRKNQCKDDCNHLVRLYERPKKPYCPVEAITLYSSLLDKTIPNFWQKPVGPSEHAGVWYLRQPLKKIHLSKMFSEICSYVGLTEQHSNFCLTATTYVIYQDRFKVTEGRPNDIEEFSKQRSYILTSLLDIEQLIPDRYEDAAMPKDDTGNYSQAIIADKDPLDMIPFIDVKQEEEGDYEDSRSFSPKTTDEESGLDFLAIKVEEEPVICDEPISELPDLDEDASDMDHAGSPSSSFLEDERGSIHGEMLASSNLFDEREAGNDAEISTTQPESEEEQISTDRSSTPLTQPLNRDPEVLDFVLIEDTRHIKRDNASKRKNSDALPEEKMHTKKDQFDIFGEYVARMLRELDDDDLFIEAKIKIDSILLDTFSRRRKDQYNWQAPTKAPKRQTTSEALTQNLAEAQSPLLAIIQNTTKKRSAETQSLASALTHSKAKKHAPSLVPVQALPQPQNPTKNPQNLTKTSQNPTKKPAQVQNNAKPMALLPINTEGQVRFIIVPQQSQMNVVGGVQTSKAQSMLIPNNQMLITVPPSNQTFTVGQPPGKAIPVKPPQSNITTDTQSDISGDDLPPS